MEIGDDFFIRSSPIQTHIDVKRSGKLIIGHRVSIGHGAGISSHHSVEIGDDVLIGSFVLIMDTDHHYPGNRTAEPARGPIFIGSGCRIGPHATILRGSHIGEGAYVEAGSVVSGRIAPGARVSGVMARERGPRLA
jgi:acetyltransferase-like isoleucine patch superfamily enzyme